MTARGWMELVLRVVGGVMLVALVFVVCPFGWMQAIHERVGMGELGYTPLLSYLIRTLSAMYASVGALLLFVSRDVERYGPVIRLLAWIAIGGGAGVTALDAMLHLPAFWTATEGPLTVALGVVLLALLAKLPKAAQQRP
jgi:hypothetical protein